MRSRSGGLVVWAVVLVVIGALIAVAPIVLAARSAHGGNMGDESGAGAYLWGLFVTVPIGGVFFLAGVVLGTIALVRATRGRDNDPGRSRIEIRPRR
jgi:uncharacterized membrane protein